VEGFFFIKMPALSRNNFGGSKIVEILFNLHIYMLFIMNLERIHRLTPHSGIPPSRIKSSISTDTPCNRSPMHQYSRFIVDNNLQARKRNRSKKHDIRNKATGYPVGF